MAGNSDKGIITEAASKYGIDPKILWGLYGTETSFGKNVSRSSAGAEGPFQFEPATARAMGVNPHDFKSAAFGAARYLAQYKGRGVGGMLSAYNAGPAGGYQSGYVNTTLQNAKTYGSMPGSPATGTESPSKGTERVRTIPGTTQATFNAEGFQKALQKAQSNRLLLSLPGGKELEGLFNTKGPLRSEYEGTSTTPPKTEVLKGPGTQGIVPPGHELHGLLPLGAKVLQWNRKDQGHDVLLKPGQSLLATGDGEVVRIGSDPKGFGPDYPIIRWFSGPEAGKTTYYGHTDAAGGLKAGQKVRQGQTVAYTSKTGHNAPPGWLEYGYAPGGTPGPFGQATPF